MGQLKKLCYAILLLILTYSCGFCDVYVALSGNDSNTGTIDNPYQTIQKGVDALKIQGPGNTLYLRGGTYTTIPTDGATRGIQFLTLNDATSWNNSYTIRSYPGEWAVIDAGSYTTDNKVFVFYGGDLTGGRGFIEFSNLEIKNAHGLTHCAGINVRGGPFRFRFLYIHDNICAIPNNNPAGLELTNGTGLCEIEYNIFYRNGSNSVDNENSANIVIFSDYIDGWGAQELTNASGFSTARHLNTIQYNLIDGGSMTCVGIKHKQRQYLESSTDFEGPIVDTNNWKDKGENYHHNIILGHTMSGLMLASDFDQIHNNIVDNTNSLTYSAIQIGSTPADGRPPSDTVFYNNTIKNSNRGISYNYVNDNYPVFYNRIYNYNNLMDSSIDESGYRDVSLMLLYDNTITWDIDTLCQFHYNVFYNPDNLVFFRILTSDGSFYNQYPWAISNMSKAYSESDYIFRGMSGADSYKLNSGYSDYTTMASGGYNNEHPYLAGITIPSYIGAVNPADDAWVDGVLSMDASFFTTAEGDPDWIGGAAPTPENPVVEILTASGQTTTASVFAITGTATADIGQTISGVTCSGQTVTPDDGVWDEQSESFTCLANLALGENTLAFVGSDGTRTGSDSIVINRTSSITKITNVTLQGTTVN